MKKIYNVHTVWIAMMVLTLSTYFLGKLNFSGIAPVLILLVIAMIKGTFIIRDFMELKGVSLLWRVIMYGWLTIVCFVIGVTYIESVA